MKALLAVFFGSGLGGITRFYLSRMVNNNNIYAFPLGTFAVNVIACLILGFLLGYGDRIETNTKLLLAAGFCGGFSTFSTFSGETFFLLQQGNYLQAFLYIMASVIVCIAATFFGHWMAG